MYTMLGYSVSHDPAGVYTALTPVPDQLYQVEGNAFRIPSNYNKLLGAFACVGALGAQVRLIAPSLREIGLEMVSPVVLGVAPAAEHLHSITPQRVIELVPGESIEMHENSNPAAAEQHTGVILLADQEIAPVKGKIRSIGFTLTVAQVLNAWTSAVPVFDDDLPVANYQCVGLRLEMAGGIAARIAIQGYWNRPGIMISGTAGVNDAQLFRYGNMGVLVEFNLLTALNIEVLVSAAVASAAYRGVIDVIKK